MEPDEALNPNSEKITLGDDLSNTSVGELEKLILVLKDEIVRVEAELAKKQAHEAAASALFKS